MCQEEEQGCEMVCKNPIVIPNPYFIDDVLRDGSDGKWLRVPCGKCTACRIQRTREWTERIMSESYYHDNSVFVTLTYDEDHVPSASSGRLTLVKKDVQDFFKRVRRRLEFLEDTRKIRYYAVGEYGDSTKRPHYHAIVFGLSADDLEILESCWKVGFVSVGSVTYDSARYVAGYVQKKLYGDKALSEYADSQAPFSLMSKGIGKEFVLDNKDRFYQGGSINVGFGKKIRRNRYTDKVLDLSHEHKRLLAEQNNHDYELWPEFEDYVLEHDDYDEIVTREYQLGLRKKQGREQYNLELDRKYSKGKGAL